MERFPLYLLLLLSPCITATECPDDTLFDTGNPDLGCVFFGEKAKTWIEAHELCEGGYIGHMAEATTIDQVTNIMVVSKKPPIKSPNSFPTTIEPAEPIFQTQNGLYFCQTKLYTRPIGNHPTFKPMICENLIKISGQRALRGCQGCRGCPGWVNCCRRNI